jgi:hypothetical protein
MAARATVIPFRSQSDTTDPSEIASHVVKVEHHDTGRISAQEVELAATPVIRSATVFTLQNLGSGRTFVHPLYVLVEQLPDEWLATSTDLALVGRGDSDFEALNDLREHVAELFESLVEMRDTLGPDLLQQLAFLERLAGNR